LGWLVIELIELILLDLRLHRPALGLRSPRCSRCPPPRRGSLRTLRLVSQLANLGIIHVVVPVLELGFDVVVHVHPQRAVPVVVVPFAVGVVVVRQRLRRACVLGVGVTVADPG
jgi:hypothetical protein